MVPDENLVSDLLKPTGSKLALTVALLFVFALTKVPGVRLTTVPFVSNNLLGPFVETLYAPVGIQDLISIVLAYLVASLLFFVGRLVDADLSALGRTAPSRLAAIIDGKHIGLTVVSALVMGYFGVPLGYLTLGTQCPAVSSCSPSGPAFEWMSLLGDLVFWYVVWGVVFAGWQQLNTSNHPLDIP